MINSILVIGQLPPPIHGSNIMTEVLIKSLQELSYPFCLVEKKFSLQQKEVGKPTLNKALKVPFLLKNLFLTCKKHRPNLCIFFISLGPTSFLCDALSIFILRLFKINYLLYIHGIGIKRLVQSKNPIISYLAQTIFRNAFGALILGENMRSEIAPFLCQNRIFILPNAIPDMTAEFSNIDISTDNHLKLLYLSNLRPSKGIMDFLEMAKKIHSKRKDVHFIIAGPYRDKRFFNEINKVIQKEKLARCTKLVGEVSGEEKAKLFATSDIFVFPSHQEAFPLVNIEAMEWAIPVISTNVGCIREMIINNINGFIVEPHDVDMLTDRVTQLLDDPILRKKMGNAGRMLYEKNYTIKTYKKNLKNILVFIDRSLNKK